MVAWEIKGETGRGLLGTHSKKSISNPQGKKKENSYLDICLSTITGKEHLLLRAIHIAELWSSGCLSWDKSCLLIFNQSFAQLLW